MGCCISSNATTEVTQVTPQNIKLENSQKAQSSQNDICVSSIRDSIMAHIGSPNYHSIKDSADLQNNINNDVILSDYRTISHTSPLIPEQDNIDQNITSEFLQKYSDHNFIGHGNYSDVYLIIEKSTQNKFCKKQVKNIKLNSTKNVFTQEIDILSKCDHFGIVKFIECFPIENIIIMEYIDGNTLKNIILEHEKENKDIEEKEILFIFYQLCICLYYLNSKNIIHRDIKSENIIITNYNDISIVKLIDFGFATECEFSDEFCGTPYYISPEIYMREKYNNLIDIWALGVIIFEMIEFDRPFLGNDRSELKKNIIHEQYILKKKNSYSNDFLSIVDSMLEKDNNRRCTVKQILKQNIMINTSIEFREKIKKSSINDKEKNDILKYIQSVNYDLGIDDQE
jgi:serine/threonine protein kinase